MNPESFEPAKEDTIEFAPQPGVSNSDVVKEDHRKGSGRPKKKENTENGSEWRLS